MSADKSITDLPVAAAINASDVSVLVSGNTDYQYTFTLLLQYITANLTTGTNISFGTTLPQNTTGSNGDIFINTSAGAFAQKTSGVWVITYTLPTASAADGTMLYGPGMPETTTGKDSDSYIDTLTGIFYRRLAGSWSQVFSMATGPQGPQGTPGTNGVNGTSSNTILFGNGMPSNSLTGNNGDFYINTANYTLFGPKASGIWASSVSLLGVGVIEGGTAGQVLAKADGTDYNTTWQDNSFANLTGQAGDNASLASALSAKQNSLGFTPENAANKNQPNGYAGLDATGKVAAAQLPSYVDDVLEATNYAALPSTGETGKIYVTLDTNYEYRWSGSAYIQLVASPGSTDAVPEGTTNKYFTAARVLAAVLSGLSFGTVTAVTAADTILSAIGKLQSQLTSVLAKTLPAGGITGQVLAKNSAAAYDAGWINPPAASSGSSNFSYNFYQSVL